MDLIFQIIYPKLLYKNMDSLFEVISLRDNISQKHLMIIYYYHKNDKSKSYFYFGNWIGWGKGIRDLGEWGDATQIYPYFARKKWYMLQSWQDLYFQEENYSQKYILLHITIKKMVEINILIQIVKLKLNY